MIILLRMSKFDTKLLVLYEYQTCDDLAQTIKQIYLQYTTLTSRKFVPIRNDNKVKDKPGNTLQNRVKISC